MNNYTLNWLLIFVIPIGIIEVTNSRKCFFAFISLSKTTTDLQAPETLQYITRRAKWKDVKTCFSAPQNAKYNQLKHKTKCVTDLFVHSEVFEYERLYFSLRGEHIKDKRLH